MANRNQGFMRIVYAAGYSWQGLRAAWKNEAAFRQELILFFILTPTGYWLGENGLERAVLIGSLMLVLIVEVLNSAIEAVVDRFGEEQHELSGRAKDMGSAAVFLSLMGVLVIWPLILCEKLF